MQRIKQNHQQLELVYNKQTKAIINLNNQGGRLQSLIFEGNSILEDLEHKPYSESYAASILFPFANRISKGRYSFKHNTYQLNCNEVGRDNAIHGLIYDKKFEVKEKKDYTDSVEATLVYEEKNKVEGFPFLYTVELTYTLSATHLSLAVFVKNTGKDAFPFNLGWHPYFCCEDFDTSFLSFNSHKMVVLDQNKIALGVSEYAVENPFSLKNKTLDDCYVLDGREIEFHTPSYQIELEGFPKSTYLQLYTPPNEKRIAIEPMTGVSDSFNHKKGIQVLKPNATKKETWKITYSPKKQ